MALDGETARQITGLLHDPEFVAFMQEAPEDYLHHVRPEDFEGKLLPHGMDATLAWEFVSFARRMAGRPTVAEINAEAHLPLDRHSFWTMSTGVVARFSEIANRSTSSSALWSRLEALQNRPRALAAIVEELHAASLRDGLGLEYEDVRRLVVEGAAPVSDEEHVLANALAIIGDLAHLAEEQPSAALLESLYARLAKGAENLRPTPYRSPEPAISPALTKSSADTIETIVRQSAYPHSWGIHPLFDVLIIADTIWLRPPFDRFNGMMEVIVRWMSYERIGTPTLRFVPLSKIRLDWERRLIGPPEAPMRFGEALSISSFGADSTPYLLQITKFLLQGLEHLERAVERIEHQNARCKHLVEGDGRFTLRQKQVLCELIDDPTRSLDVREYETRFDVAPSTARSDLTKLVSTHCLMTEFHGKKQVFWIRPDIERALEHLPS